MIFLLRQGTVKLQYMKFLSDVHTWLLLFLENKSFCFVLFLKSLFAKTDIPVRIF